MKNDYNKFKQERCLVTDSCGSFFTLDIDHVLTQKSYPEFKYEPWNCMTTCRKHHSERHRIGLVSFSIKYPVVNDWLVSNGFSLVLGKWRRDV